MSTSLKGGKKAAQPTQPAYGIDATTQAFIGGAANLSGADARKALILAAADLAAAMEGLTMGSDTAFLSFVLWPGARGCGLSEREADRVISEVVTYVQSRGGGYNPATIAADLTDLVRPTEPGQPSAHFLTLWETFQT